MTRPMNAHVVTDSPHAIPPTGTVIFLVAVAVLSTGAVIALLVWLFIDATKQAEDDARYLKKRQKLLEMQAELINLTWRRR